MQLLMTFLLETAKKEEDPWYLAILKSIWKEVLDLGKDFRDFFLMIKEHTYDALADKFGATGVALVFIAIMVILFMIIITRVIRGKDD